jgi:hypothetical protein
MQQAVDTIQKFTCQTAESKEINSPRIGSLSLAMLGEASSGLQLSTVLL